MKFVLNILILVVAFSFCGTSSATVTFASCRWLLTKPSSEGQYEFKDLFEAALWLNQNRFRINPKTTHLAIMVNLLKSIRRSIADVLPYKRSDLHYAELEPHLKDLLQEIDQSILQERVTYEFLVALPHRAGLLLRTNSTWDQTTKEDAKLLDFSTYSSHERFMAVVEDVRAEKIPAVVENFVRELLGALDNFPDRMALPVALRDPASPPHTRLLSYREINFLEALNIWPIGIATRPEYDPALPGVRDELCVPGHDYGHLRAYFFMAKYADHRIPPTLLAPLRMRVVRAIEGSSLSEGQKEILHYIHGIVFHEAPTVGIALMTPEGKTTSAISKLHIQLGIANKVNQNLAPNQKYFPELEKLLKECSGGACFNGHSHAIAVYRKMLEEN